MSEQADSVNTQEDTAPAGGEQAEQSIPKYRYDEVAARLRDAEDKLRQKDDQLDYARRAAMPQQQIQDDNSELEALGFDQNHTKAVSKLIQREAQKLAQPLRAAVAHLAGSVEEQQFLIQHGKDKSSYLPKIKAMKQEYAMRGMPLDSDMAYKYIRYDEMEAAAARKPAPRQQEANIEREASAPPPATKVAAKHFNEMSIEEKEAQLEEQFRANGPI